MSDEFKVHKLNAGGMNAARQLQLIFEIALQDIQNYCPPGRELSLVITNLQQASFWAKRGMAQKAENNE